MVARPTKKLTEKQLRPFTITKKIGNTSYRLKLLDTWIIYNVFHSSYLTPFKPSKFPSQQKPLQPPLIINDEEEPEYEVETILNSRKRRNKVQYLVHWKGYPSEEDTWEPLSNLENTQEALQQYHQQHPTAPHDSSFQIRQVVFNDPRIFDWTTQDVPTIPKQLSNTDLLTKISTNVMDDIITKRKEMLTFQQPIPSTIKRIWFVEDNQLTFVAVVHTLNPHTVKILCLYQHLSPIEYAQLPIDKNGSTPQLLPSWFTHVNQPYLLKFF
jgi:hypothetical protein